MPHHETNPDDLVPSAAAGEAYLAALGDAHRGQIAGYLRGVPDEELRFYEKVIADEVTRRKQRGYLDRLPELCRWTPADH